MESAADCLGRSGYEVHRYRPGQYDFRTINLRLFAAAVWAGPPDQALAGRCRRCAVPVGSISDRQEPGADWTLPVSQVDSSQVWTDILSGRQTAGQAGDEPRPACRQARPMVVPLWVVIPTHNRLAALRTTLASIEAQDYPPEAVVVVDDGSTDGTADWLRDQIGSRKAEGGSQKAEVRSQKSEVGGLISAFCLPTSDFRLLPSVLHPILLPRNRGVGYARRVGTALVPSDAVVVDVDDHDPLLPGALGAIAEAFRDPDTWFVYGDVETDGPCPEPDTKPDYTPWLFARDRCHAWGCRAYRRVLLNCTEGHNMTTRVAEDYELFLRMEAVLGGRGFRRIAQPLCTVNRHTGISIDGRLRQDQDDNGLLFRSMAAEHVFKGLAPPQMIRRRARPILGIWSPSRAQGLAMLARQIGDLAATLGLEWEIFDWYGHWTPLGDPVWDRRLTPERNFRTWARNKCAMIFIEHLEPAWLDEIPPDMPTVFIPMWEWQCGQTHELARRATYLVTPANCVGEYFRSRGYDNVRSIPWGLPLPLRAHVPHLPTGRQGLSAGLPDGSQGRQGGRQGQVRLYHNASLPHPRRNTWAVLDAFRQAAPRNPRLHLTLKMQTDWDHLRRGIDPKWMARERTLTGLLQEEYPDLPGRQAGRFTWTVAQDDRATALDRYTEHDIMPYASDCEGLGLMLQEALHCGLPIVAPNIPPINEWVHHERNGLLYDCPIHEFAHGVPQATIDPGPLADILATLVPPYVEHLAHHCHDGLAQRYEHWKHEWTLLLRRLRG